MKKSKVGLIAMIVIGSIIGILFFITSPLVLTSQSANLGQQWIGYGTIIFVVGMLLIAALYG